MLDSRPLCCYYSYIMLPAQPNQSLIDGLACLQALAANPKPMGVRELAKEIGLEPTRVNRLLKTLAHIGMAKQTPKRKYEPGPAVHVLSAQCMFASGLLKRALGPLRALQEETECTVALGVLWRDKVSYLYHGEPGTDPTEALGRMSLYDAFGSSIGHVLLAAYSAEQLKSLFGSGKNCVWEGGQRALGKHLREVRRAGYYHLVPPGRDAGSVAVPIGSPPYAALACAGRFSEKGIERLLPIMKTTASKIDAEPTS